MYKILAIVSFVLVLLGIAIGFFVFPILMNKIIRHEINLRPGSDTRKLWETFPFATNFSIYVFNLTNLEETQSGGKPHVEEIGPFVFEEWKDKYNIEDIEAEDAVSFNMRNTFIFRPDLGLSGDELITMPHPLLQVIISDNQQRFLPSMMCALWSQGLEIIFQPSSAFIQASFMDLFFRGINVDCSSGKFAAIAICASFHADQVKGAVKYNDTTFKFSLMGAGNHSDAGRFKVSRGIMISQDVGKVLEYDNKTELNVWNDGECNHLRGTDSTVFAPLMQPEAGLTIFSPVLCRSLNLKFQNKTTYARLPAIRYIFDMGDVQNEPENHCFCVDYPAKCPVKGTMDLFACSETPMVASMPHFLNGDANLIKNVDGINPIQEKHETHIDFEIISGTPLTIANRLQYNLAVEPIQELAVMKNLRKLTMPLFWIEESVNLEKPFTDLLKQKVFLGLQVNSAFKFMATILGIVGVLFSLCMLRLRRNDAQYLENVPENRSEENDKF